MPLLAGWPKSPGPSAAARFNVEQLFFLPTRMGTLTVHQPTGSWAYLDDEEVGRLRALTGRTARQAARALKRPISQLRRFADIMWRRGLLAADGRHVVAPEALTQVIEAQVRRSFCLLFNLAPVCNLACRYCYLAGAEHGRPVSRMPKAGITAIEKALARPERELAIDFGETAGAERIFHALVRHVASASTGGRSLQCLIQTNGTGLNSEEVEFLVAHRIAVGLSLDGPGRLHDRMRRFRSGRGSYEQAARGLRRLVERDVAHWVFATIGRHNVSFPEEVLGHLWELGARDYVFKRVLPLGVARRRWKEVGITAAEFDEFLARAVRLALRRSVDDLDITRRKHLLRALMDRRGWKTGCTSRHCFCGAQYVVVESDGRLAPCPRFAGRRDGRQSPRWVGSDLDPGWAGRAGAGPWPPACRNCPWQMFCGGGCALTGPRDPECPAYRTTYALIFSEIIPHIFEQGEFNPERIGALRPVRIECRGA